MDHVLQLSNLELCYQGTLESQKDSEFAPLVKANAALVVEGRSCPRRSGTLAAQRSLPVPSCPFQDRKEFRGFTCPIREAGGRATRTTKGFPTGLWIVLRRAPCSESPTETPGRCGGTRLQADPVMQSSKKTGQRLKQSTITLLSYSVAYQHFVGHRTQSRICTSCSRFHFDGTTPQARF